jgi:hypothetical protein
MSPRFARDMEQAAYVQLQNARLQGLDGEECIRFAAASIGHEHEALVRRVWASRFTVMGGAG